MRADVSAKLCNLDVLGMYRVGIKRRAILEDHNESRVIRAREKQRIKAYRETSDLGNYPSQLPQQINVLFASKLFNVVAILPNHDVCQHFLYRWTDVFSIFHFPFGT